MGRIYIPVLIKISSIALCHMTTTSFKNLNLPIIFFVNKVRAVSCKTLWRAFGNGKWRWSWELTLLSEGGHLLPASRTPLQDVILFPVCIPLCSCLLSLEMALFVSWKLVRLGGDRARGGLAARCSWDSNELGQLSNWAIFTIILWSHEYLLKSVSNAVAYPHFSLDTQEVCLGTVQSTSDRSKVLFLVT